MDQIVEVLLKSQLIGLLPQPDFFVLVTQAVHPSGIMAMMLRNGGMNRSEPSPVQGRLHAE